jgi:23S rRNA pseudouridine1911/1915/1917 synthase
VRRALAHNAPRTTHDEMNIPIVYEDDCLLVLDKPAGLLTIPTPHNESRTLISILNDDARDRGLLYRLHPCHRLDRDTSGLIIFAKGKAAQKKMMEQFARHAVRKRYYAVVHGQVQPQEGAIRTAINGQPALTSYCVLKAQREFSVMDVRPETGRKNQIRIHCKQIGHPLVGESRFAFRRDYTLRAKRALLHAVALDFEHPIDKRPMHLEALVPKDMQLFIGQSKGMQ